MYASSRPQNPAIHHILDVGRLYAQIRSPACCKWIFWIRCSMSKIRFSLSTNSASPRKSESESIEIIFLQPPSYAVWKESKTAQIRLNSSVWKS